MKFPVPVLHGRQPLSVLLLGLLLAACASQAASESKVSESDGALMVETKITGFALSARSASAGPVTFNVANSDDMPHDFALSGNGVEYTTKRLQPGESESFTLELAAGTYTYLCTMEGHGIMMTGSLTVN